MYDSDCARLVAFVLQGEKTDSGVTGCSQRGLCQGSDTGIRPGSRLSTSGVTWCHRPGIALSCVDVITALRCGWRKRNQMEVSEQKGGAKRPQESAQNNGQKHAQREARCLVSGIHDRLPKRTHQGSEPTDQWDWSARRQPTVTT
ncbi:hypothetical protein G7B40_039945 [Aetokthonos hydrillicola Thurmond2011]|uniref:Uncharacterized protein n=1 Tax=Aetokthonos hydrillicola Thurmond2011 TaxID=2712845 RepID=A0AAP5MEB1_9CYAN|nr:hypothetical protein [Aetokthonos hydrillicola]MBW4590105.1 hypothetical protein [Aetokthonos hydrillicola CCALA 1050]MDR9900664.1 hypothetical protein [Aetokthonos hydrillicola Thurmond2011]